MKLTTLLLVLAAAASSASQAAPAKKKPVKKPVPARAAPRAVAPPPAPVPAAAPVNFAEWPEVQAFADEIALRHGFPRAELDAVIAQIRYVESSVQLVKPAPPGKPKNWQTYSRNTVEPIRIAAGVKFWNTHAATLLRAEAEFGVPAEIIVGIIGVETIYGRNTGRFRIMDVLTTLGFAYPDTPNRAARMAFFKGELENTLLLARLNQIDPFSLLGSFAGAIGMPQFMPGSVLAYGVDFDNNGTLDLRNSPVDTIGSVASFLLQHGWQRADAGPPAYRADVAPGKPWEPLLGKGLRATLSQEELAAAGVSIRASVPRGMQFGLVDLPNGPDPTEYWVANNNFFAITQYNRSYFYAMSVIDLGRAVRLARQANQLAPAETL